MLRRCLNLMVALLFLAVAAGPAFAASSDSVVVSGYILPTSRPRADFSATPTNGAAPLSVQFSDQSTRSPETWAWDFDNNGVVDSTVQNPAYTYTSPGTYTVKLTVANGLGSDSKVRNRYITVTAQDPTPKIRALEEYVRGLSIPHWTKMLLTTPLSNAEYFIRHRNDRAAVSMMRVFIQNVRLLRWFGFLNANQANYMTGEAHDIIDLINAG